MLANKKDCRFSDNFLCERDQIWKWLALQKSLEYSAHFVWNDWRMNLYYAKNVDHKMANAATNKVIAIRKRVNQKMYSTSGSLSMSSQVGISISVSQPTVSLRAF